VMRGTGSVGVESVVQFAGRVVTFALSARITAVCGPSPLPHGDFVNMLCDVIIRDHDAQPLRSLLNTGCESAIAISAKLLQSVPLSLCVIPNRL
jgi:hypothetical protein